MSKWIINNSGATRTYKGIPVDDGTTFEITQDRYPAFASCANLVEDVGAGTVDMSKDGTASLSIAEGLELLVTVYPASKELTIVETPTFAAKKTADGKSLFNRTEGKPFSLNAGSNTVEYVIPWPTCKFTGIEIIGAEKGDHSNLKILDTATGTYSGTNNYQFNQFGYTVYVAPDFYSRESKYDADLYAGMRVVFEYESESTKTIYANFLVHEVK